MWKYFFQILWENYSNIEYLGLIIAISIEIFYFNKFKNRTIVLTLNLAAEIIFSIFNDVIVEFNLISIKMKCSQVLLLN